ncbi:aspartate carbamoyltransferase catalytic subunit [bacterium]|nr:aspartate carbamoyltransferase catalytic subunit [bacterium]
MEGIGPNLLGIKGLTREQIHYFVETAEKFVDINRRSVKKVPTLRGKTVVNLFYEVSTRTRTSFEIAAKRLSADAVNIAAQSSSVTKGETLLDTARTLEAMNPDIIVMRHPESGAPHFLAQLLKGVSIVNAGDGLHEHPTQAILDALTIKQSLGRIDKLKLVIVGDVLRGRVGRSNIFMHRALGNEVVLVGPPTLVPREFQELGVKVCYDLPTALEGADAVMSLRIKLEYLNEAFIPSSDEYAKYFCLSEKLLARHCPQAVVLAPGPYMRGLELTSEVIDGPRSKISDQVENGVSTRMAILFLLAQWWEHKRGLESSLELPA